MTEILPFDSRPAADHAAEKRHSYDVRLGGSWRVRCLRDVHVTSRFDAGSMTYVHGIAPAGTVFKTWGADSNAGFNGITTLAQVTDDDGVVWTYRGSTGCLEVVR